MLDSLENELEDIEYDRRSTAQDHAFLLDMKRSQNTLESALHAETVSSLLHTKISDEENQSVHSFRSHIQNSLKLLLRFNAYNDAFYIWHDGQFGTINGLRLGRLPSHNVEWTEINAGLGQTALLYTVIAEKSGFHSNSRRRVVLPQGSFSKCLSADRSSYGYNLYCDGSFLKKRSFNQALTIFLSGVDDLGKYLMSLDESLKLPYEIRKGKIGDMSITLGDDETWTMALKYVLTHLKWQLAWVAKHCQ